MSPAEAQVVIGRDLQGLRLGAGILAVAGLAACAAGWALHSDAFYRAYLVAYVFWAGVPLGALTFAMIYALVGGAWGQTVKAVLLANARLMPLIAVLFIPIFFGLDSLYAWARPDAAADPALAHKLVYLNKPGFMIRAVACLAVWSGLGIAVARLSSTADQRAAPAPQKLRVLCAAGLLAYVVTGSIAAIDWVLSLEREYYSTVFGPALLVDQALVGLSTAIVLTVFLRGQVPLAEPELSKPPTLVARDLGSILAALVLLWAYLQFAQLLINWSGDRPDEIGWYQRRLHGPWGWISAVAGFAQFAVPFFVLLFRRLKGRFESLAWIAAGIFAAHALETAWLVAPSFPALTPGGIALGAAAFLGIGGVWLAGLVVVAHRFRRATAEVPP